jgi:hypothetical protein
VALVHILLVAAIPVTVVAMVVLQLPVVLVAVLVATLALVVIPLPTAMAMLAAVAVVALVADIVPHTGIPVAEELALLVKALRARVSAIWVATAAVAAKTAIQAKIPTTAMANQTGPVAFMVEVQVALVTMLHLVTEYKLGDAGALGLFGEQEEAFHQQAQETCDVIINGYCFV